MNKKTVGLLFGVGAGIGIAWLFRRHLFGFGPEVRYIVLEEDRGTCRVVTKPAYVTLSHGQKLTWLVTNNCAHDVEVCLTNWNDGHGHPKNPAVDPDPDPHDPGQLGLCRKVPSGQSRKIKSKGKRPTYSSEIFHYDVYLDGSLGADPIIKLVL